MGRAGHAHCGRRDRSELRRTDADPVNEIDPISSCSSIVETTAAGEPNSRAATASNAVATIVQTCARQIRDKK